MELIPGLPDDLARQCLLRVHFQCFPSLISVCKALNREIQSPEFHQRRRLLGYARPVFVLTLRDRVTPSSLSILVFDPKTGIWTPLPPMPHLPPIHPNFGGIVHVGSNKILVISTGWDIPPSTEWDRNWPINVVHVFDFVTGQWHQVADMPSPGDMPGPAGMLGPAGRARFGLASDPSRGEALVAGAQVGEERRQTMVYYAAYDGWECSGDLAIGRASCSAVFHAGRFHVFGGMHPPNTEYEGYSYTTSIESLDPESFEWGPPAPKELGFLEEHSNCNQSSLDFSIVMENGEGVLYSIHVDGRVRRGGGEGWEDVAKLPREIYCRFRAVTWKDKMLVNGSRVYQYYPDNEPFYTYLLDLNNGEWTKVDMYHGYSATNTRLEKGCGMYL